MAHVKLNWTPRSSDLSEKLRSMQIGSGTIFIYVFLTKNFSNVFVNKYKYFKHFPCLSMSVCRVLKNIK